MKKRAIVSIFLSIALLAAGIGFAVNSLGGFPPGPPESGSPGTGKSGAPATDGGSSAGQAQSASEPQPVAVQVAEAERRDLRGEVELNGEIEAANRVSVYPEVSGTVQRIEVAEGQYVAKDEALVQVDSSRPGAQYQASPVESPIAGTVVSVRTEQGAQAGPSAPVAVVATLNRMRITVEVPERYAAVVKRGMQAEVDAFAFQDRAYRATVSSVEPVLDSGTRSKAVKLRFSRARSELEPGMFVRVSLPLRRAADTVAVPFRAIVQEGGEQYVYTVADGIARRVQVRSGIIADDTVQIVEGLEAGSSVVTEGIEELRPNRPVSIKEGGA
jgi:membrane fusion protein (multidrug efflux system)